ncbi:hypothetical protein Spb1_06230 [Planctopirus ephydatiae]|uniref:Transglutaminase-like superfamily protein n=1 Tax=Planctopirus ephydatiae TaxID=2528019 RepID=A0A518GJJ2_9PLAN|nr:hypothetical protein Spb1_06230 [Planctopirus ephydatiae]
MPSPDFSVKVNAVVHGSNFAHRGTFYSHPNSQNETFPRQSSDAFYSVWSTHAASSNRFRGNLVQLARMVSAWSLAILCLVVLSGCPAKAPASKESEPSAQADKSVGTARQTAKILDGALHQLRPENLGIDSDLKTAIPVLNTWIKIRKESETLPTVSEKTLAFFGEAQKEILESAIFDNADGTHIRDSILFDEVAGHVTTGASSDTERVNRVFFYCLRNVSLLSESEEELPLGAYDTLFLGRGTALARASVFFEIMRQLRIDAFVLAEKPVDTLGEEWLIGVLVDGKVLVYDPIIGLPIPPGKSPSLLVNQPVATLAELEAHPEWLALHSPRKDQPYRLSSESVAKLKPLIVTDPRWSARRMLFLQESLTGNNSSLVAQPIFGSEGEPGLWDRVSASHSGWKELPPLAWPYPENRLQKMGKMTPTMAQLLQESFRPFEAPVEMGVDPKTRQKVLGSSLFRQFRNRILQLSGDYSQAISAYMTIRQLSAITGVYPPPIERLHLIAAEDALFFSAISKIEDGDIKGGVALLTEYINRYRTRGRWRSVARVALVDGMLKMGDLKGARNALDLSISQDPYRTLVILIKNSLPAANEADAKAPAGESQPAAVKPADSQPVETKPAADKPTEPPATEPKPKEPKSEEPQPEEARS